MHWKDTDPEHQLDAAEAAEANARRNDTITGLLKEAMTTLADGALPKTSVARRWRSKIEALLPKTGSQDAMAHVEALVEALNAAQDPAKASDWTQRTGIVPLVAAAKATQLMEDTALATRPVLNPPPFGAAAPDPVLWRDPGKADWPDQAPDWRDPVLAAGEIAVLAGPGSAGKSTVALALAREACPADGGDFGAACGIRVRTGRVVILSYEDSPDRIAGRMTWTGTPDAWDHVRIVLRPAPLWEADPEDRLASGPSPFFPQFWDSVHDFRPSLVIIDPASVAFSGASPNDGSAVRAFLLAVAAEAERSGFGVLLVAHDTKAARSEAKAGGDPGAGAVAGSSQWFDGVRGVLHLASYPSARSGPVLRCAKANYGPSGWGAALRSRTDADGRWQGLELDRRLADAEAVTNATRSPDRTNANGRTANREPKL